ncbi:protein of unknown function [Pseudodesulfovibrio piezophilus C1TLV30]|uniref:Uncharacterized protein n=1 Tax=Pseudodesulfovibrio piezophilus (strain DSM 21447 / JCM 15486 / C1TLV30) TaxID=1322246 RepID=M1WLR3_PSEP2|nr:protein of unknown function [Pseudodesulfovibrio piezophilus C1TLV30]
MACSCRTGRNTLEKRKGVYADTQRKPLKKLVPPARFEHAAPGLGILCSIHLSYGGTQTSGNTERREMSLAEQA